MQKNVLFRGCTRPPMFMGVPYVPFFIGAGSVILLSFYTNMFFLGLLPVVIFVMRQMARRDEMIFRLLGLRLQLRHGELELFELLLLLRELHRHEFFHFVFDRLFRGFVFRNGHVQNDHGAQGTAQEIQEGDRE